MGRQLSDQRRHALRVHRRTPRRRGATAECATHDDHDIDYHDIDYHDIDYHDIDNHDIDNHDIDNHDIDDIHNVDDHDHPRSDGFSVDIRLGRAVDTGGFRCRSTGPNDNNGDCSRPASGDEPTNRPDVVIDAHDNRTCRCDNRRRRVAVHDGCPHDDHVNDVTGRLSVSTHSE